MRYEGTTYIQFSRIVRQMAALNKVSMNDLLPYCKCSKTTLSKIWNGKPCNPTLNTLNGIMEFLNK